MSRPVAYIAHPYGGEPANRALAARWVAWAASIGFAPSATWIVLTGEWTEEEGREFGLECDKVMVERSDVVLLVGPHVSDGMNKEARHAELHNVRVVDLTRFDEKRAESHLRTLGLLPGVAA